MPNEEGLSWEWKRAKTFETDGEYKLCRCGRSKTSHFATVRMPGLTSTEEKRPPVGPNVRQADIF